MEEIMNNVFNTLLMLSVFVLVVAGVAGFSGSTSAQPCGITATKVAPGGDDTLFLFDITVDGGDTNTFPLPGGESTGGEFKSFVSIFELPIEGWTLEGVNCEGDGGIVFDITENGFTAQCDSGGSFGTCTFLNRGPAAIPTLSEWGMIAAAAGLVLIGVFFAVRRKRAVV